MHEICRQTIKRLAGERDEARQQAGKAYEQVDAETRDELQTSRGELAAVITRFEKERDDPRPEN